MPQNYEYMIKRKICFLTLAKGHSDRLKNKNFRNFNNKPLIHWTIKKILKISKKYFVNSDNDLILNYSKKLGAKTIIRNKKLRENNLPSRILMLESFRYFPKGTNAVIHVQANSPNLNLNKIMKVYQLLKYTNIEDVFSIDGKGNINGSIWGITKKKLLTYNLSKKIHDHKSLKNELWLLDDSIDIHYLSDLKLAEKIFKKNLKN